MAQDNLRNIAPEQLKMSFDRHLSSIYREEEAEEENRGNQDSKQGTQWDSVKMIIVHGLSVTLQNLIPQPVSENRQQRIT